MTGQLTREKQIEKIKLHMQNCVHINHISKIFHNSQKGGKQLTHTFLKGREFADTY